MTKDQKKVLCAIAAMIAFKVALYASIAYSAKVARSAR